MRKAGPVAISEKEYSTATNVKSKVEESKPDVKQAETGNVYSGTESALQATQKSPEPSALSKEPKKKLGLGTLSQLKEKTAKEKKEEVKELQLTEDLLQQFIQEYILKLTQEGKDLIRNQMAEALFSLKDQNLILATCNKHLQFNSMNNIRQDLTDFLIFKTQNPHLKISLELDELIEDDPNQMVKNKNELFSDMTEQFPVLEDLKKALGLRVVGKYKYIAPMEMSEPEVVDVSLESDHESLEDMPLDEDWMESDDN